MKLNLLHNRGYEKFYQRDNAGKKLARSQKLYLKYNTYFNYFYMYEDFVSSEIWRRIKLKLLL